MAPVVLKAVHEGSAERGLHLKDYVIWLLQTPGELNTFVGGLKASQAGRELAATILATHAARMAKADTLDLQRRKARAVLKPLWDRRSGTKGMTPLVLPRAKGALGTFHKWLSPDPRKDRRRDRFIYRQPVRT